MLGETSEVEIGRRWVRLIKVVRCWMKFCENGRVMHAWRLDQFNGGQERMGELGKGYDHVYLSIFLLLLSRVFVFLQKHIVLGLWSFFMLPWVIQKIRFVAEKSRCLKRQEIQIRTFAIILLIIQVGEGEQNWLPFQTCEQNISFHANGRRVTGSHLRRYAEQGHPLVWETLK